MIDYVWPLLLCVAIGLPAGWISAQADKRAANWPPQMAVIMRDEIRKRMFWGAVIALAAAYVAFTFWNNTFMAFAVVGSPFIGAALMKHDFWRELDKAEEVKRAKEELASGQGWGTDKKNGPAFEQPDSDDDFFRYDGGKGGYSRQSSSRGSEHYGFDKRHPDDAKFWAVVDDPNATDGERRNAFDKILRAQAKRQGKAGRDVARQTA